MKMQLISTLMAVFLFITPYLNFGQIPNLGTISTFALFTASGALTNTRASIVAIDIGTDVDAIFQENRIKRIKKEQASVRALTSSVVLNFLLTIYLTIQMYEKKTRSLVPIWGRDEITNQKDETNIYSTVYRICYFW